MKVSSMIDKKRFHILCRINKLSGNIEDQWYILTLIKVVYSSTGFGVESDIISVIFLITTILYIHIAKYQYVMHME